MNQPVIRRYLRTAAGEDPAGPADAELLARFASARDETAFELLVWRHAALIQRVCRGVLRDHHAAEDAAQAAFLILARKAHTFSGRGTVVGFLYRIARRVAVRLARDLSRRPAGAGGLEQVPYWQPEPSASADEVELLCMEVDRLPERYRIPVLLCFFEGLTHAEAARRTGWAIGTVAGRLARAKALLARRLAPRGIGAAVVLGLPAGGFIGTTAQAAEAFAARGAVVPGVDHSVLHLAEGTLRAMTPFHLKLVAAASLLCVAGTTLWGLTPTDQPQPAAGNEPAAQAAPVVQFPAVQFSAAQPPSAVRPVPQERTATAAQRDMTVNKLKQIMLAMHNYAVATGEILPHDIADKDGKPLLSWRVEILPYIEQHHMYTQFKLDEPWDSEHNKKLLRMMPAIYREEFQPKDATKTYFQVFAGPGTVFEPGKNIRVSNITDGTSNTIGVVEAGPPVEWTKPVDIAYDPKRAPKLDVPFKNVFIAGFMDGSVHTLRPDVDPAALRTLIERADGQQPPAVESLDVKFPLAKGDLEAAQKKLKEYVRLSEAITAELREQQKLLAELIRQAEQAEKLHNAVPPSPRSQPDDLAGMLESLRSLTKELRKAVEAGKKE